jgi:hypothetical protein
MQEKPRMKTFWLFLRPNFVRIMLLVFLIATTSLINVGYEPTSKVSWREYRGTPFHFVTMSGYEGPCSGNDFCRDVDVQSLNPWALIVDAVGWYLVSCAIVLGYETVKKQSA